VNSILVSRNHLQAELHLNSFPVPNLKIYPTRENENLISRPKGIGPNLNRRRTNTAYPLAETSVFRSYEKLVFHSQRLQLQYMDSLVDNMK
jgi:hypothetical protein